MRGVVAACASIAIGAAGGCSRHIDVADPPPASKQQPCPVPPPLPPPPDPPPLYVRAVAGPPAVAPQGREPPPAPPGSTVEDLVGSANPGDWDKARAILEPRVFGKHPNREDVKMLKALCKEQHDATCLQSLPPL